MYKTLMTKFQSVNFKIKLKTDCSKVIYLKSRKQLTVCGLYNRKNRTVVIFKMYQYLPAPSSRMTKKK